MKKLSIIVGVVIALLMSSCAVHMQHPSQMKRHNRHYNNGHHKHYKKHPGKKKGHYKKRHRGGRFGYNAPMNSVPGTPSKHFHYGSI